MSAVERLSPRIIQALDSLNRWLRDQSIPHAMVGGVAVALVAQPRATQDIDSLIWLEHEKWPAFLDSGRSYGFVPRISDALDFATQRRVLLLKHEPSDVNVDISFGALPFEWELIERSHEGDVGYFKVNVPSPDDLIITKAVAMRPKDTLDIVRILDLHPDLDFDRIRHWVSEFAAVLEMPEMLESLEKLLQQRKNQFPTT